MIFDYIIVGGGTTGCLIADYLSKKKYKVAIIEKGKHNKLLNFFANFPNGTFFTLKNKNFTKNYLCECSNNLNGRKLVWPRGECIGGSSAINGLVYKRGHKNDFDKLSNQGFLSWEWNKIVKYYEEIEDCLKIHNHKKYKSENLENSSNKNPIVESFLKSLEKNKFNFCDSFNKRLESNDSQCSYYDLTLNNSKRSYAYNVYLKDNKNVKIFYQSLVSKIILKNQNATGVEFIKNEKKIIINCTKEIIISAGTINSPKILQLSGIGNKNLLNSQGIKINYENDKVGTNLRDHLQTKLTYKINSKRNYNYLANKINLLYQTKQFVNYLIFKKGPFSKGAIRAGAFVGTEHDESRHNFQINLLLASGTYEKLDKFNGVSVSVNSLNPQSTGYIKIKSKNPYEDPVIQPNYLENANDLEKLLKGIKLIRKIAQTDPFSKLIEKEVIPGRSTISRNDLINFIKDASTTIYHPTGTCKIGKEGDGVVDERLRVWGIKNLRVCDASVFPESLTGNIVASCYLAGMVLVKDILS
jgi:choline dehydrogenase